MKRVAYLFGLLFLSLFIVYNYLPKTIDTVLNKNLPFIQEEIEKINSFIKNKEKKFHIKPDNESRIIWANDSIYERTNCSVLYLHGFSGSWHEAYPAHVKFAEKFGCNLYLPRLHDHGLITEDPLIDTTPDKLWESSKEALMVAHMLGQKVVVMGTSTGGTLALKLAADFPEYVDALILYSPNIRIKNSAALLLSKPWGLQIARKVMQSNYIIANEDFESKDCQYRNCKYRIEATVYLQQLLESTMKEDTYKNVTAPVFLGYYYKDEEHQDDVVRVDAMLKMFEQLGTTEKNRIKKAFPEAGHHVIGCELTSKGVESVINETINFGQVFLNLKPVK